MKTNIYTMTEGKTMEGIVGRVKVFLHDKGMDVQCIEMKDGNYLIQGREQDAAIMQWVGGDRAVTVHLTAGNDNKVIVKAGEGKWMDKIIGTIWGLSSWPVMVVTVVATYRQLRLPAKIMHCVENYLREPECVMIDTNCVETK